MKILFPVQHANALGLHEFSNDEKEPISTTQIVQPNICQLTCARLCLHTSTTCFNITGQRAADDELKGSEQQLSGPRTPVLVMYIL